MNKVLCIGTSLGLPRDEVKYEDTWFCLLKERFKGSDFIGYFRRAQVMSEMSYLYDSYYRFYYPDYVIFEMGINDSAPRYIIEQKLFWKMVLRLIQNTWLEKPFWSIVKRIRKRDPNRVATSLQAFEQYTVNMIENFVKLGAKKIIILKIEAIGSIPRRKSPFWMSNIDKYNAVYETIANNYSDIVLLVDANSYLDDECYIDDGYHPNKNGMRIIYSFLESCLSEYIE